MPCLSGLSGVLSGPTCVPLWLPHQSQGHLQASKAQIIMANGWWDRGEASGLCPRLSGLQASARPAAGPSAEHLGRPGVSWSRWSRPCHHSVGCTLRPAFPWLPAQNG